MQTSRLLSMFEEGEPVWMVNPGGASIDVVDMLARVGVRCVFVHCERTAVHIESVTAMVRCASSHGMATVVRSGSMQPEILVRYLDRGIDGIVLHDGTDPGHRLRAVRRCDRASTKSSTGV